MNIYPELQVRDTNQYFFSLILGVQWRFVIDSNQNEHFVHKMKYGTHFLSWSVVSNSHHKSSETSVSLNFSPKVRNCDILRNRL